MKNSRHIVVLSHSHCHTNLLYCKKKEKKKTSNNIIEIIYKYFSVHSWATHTHTLTQGCRYQSVWIKKRTQLLIKPTSSCLTPSHIGQLSPRIHKYDLFFRRWCFILNFFFLNFIQTCIKNKNKINQFEK